MLASVGLALASAALFGLSGPFAKALLEAGWSPLVVVLARITGAALILVAALLLMQRGRTRERLDAIRADRSTILLFGIAAIAGVQLCFFSAVQYLPVSVALLIEFLAPAVVLALVAPLPLLALTADLSGTVGIGPARAPWWVAVLVLAVASGALAYAVGVVAIARLGAPRAAVVGLSEVVFAAVVAWIMLGEVLTGVQLGGALAILAGLVVVERGRSGIATQPVEPIPAPRLEEQ
nr:DMT family transporter [Lolliginicoccus lacisalsi]